MLHYKVCVEFKTHFQTLENDALVKVWPVRYTNIGYTSGCSVGNSNTAARKGMT